MRKPVLKLLYPFEVPALLYCLAGLLCARSYGIKIDWSVALDSRYDLVILSAAARYSLIVLLFLYAKKRWAGEERPQILTDLRDLLRTHLAPWKDWRRWVELVRAVLAIKACILVYTHLKQAIPLMNPQLYDGALWTIDRWVHLGLSPVDTSLTLFSSPWLTRPIDALYVFWYTVKVPFLVYFLFFASARRSWHFLSCYLLLWALGGAFAILIPTLGPIYTNPELFAGLDMPFARTLQEGLWVHYLALAENPSTYQVSVYDGIAAFPSLHVGFVALFTVSVWRIRKLFWLMLGYTLVIQLGSVHLGWHYAVDGYFSALVVLALWFGLSPLFREPVPQAPDDPVPSDGAEPEATPAANS